MEIQSSRAKAIFMLVLATCGWAVSFPIFKALGASQAQILGESKPSSWFFSSYSLVLRFGISGLILLAFQFRNIFALTKQELVLGAGLGVFGGVGTLFQMDGLAYTDASTSAFLTQCYCLTIPLFLAIRN